MEGFIKYLKNTGWLLVNRFFGMIIGFFVTVMVVRHLGPENNGILNFAISFVGLFGFIATLGLDNVIYRNLVKYPEKENVYLGTGLWLRMISGLIAIIGSIILGRIANADDTTFYTILIVSLAFFFQAFTLIIYAFQAKVHSYLVAISSMIVVAILAILKIGTIYYNHGIYYFAAIYTIEPLLYGIFYLFFFKKYYSSPFKWIYNSKIARELLKDSLPLMLSVVFVGLYSRIDQVLIKYLIDVRSVGIYDPAVRLAEVWYFVPAIITSSLFPSIINAKKVSERVYARRIFALTGFLVFVSIVVGVFVSFFAYFIMDLVFGEEFISGYKVLQLYVWSGVGIGLGFVINHFLLAENMSRVILYISIVGLAINLALNLLLIPIYGISGSAFATLVSYIIGPLSVVLFPAARKKILALAKIARTPVLK